MKTEDDPIGKTKILRASIGMITRGGPFVVNVYQDTQPVMLKGMPLPAEASYGFKDPTNHSSHLVNHPISIELFFGDNGREQFDISLGSFQLQEFLPPYAGPRNIELRLAVSSQQVLTITLLDAKSQKCRSIGFVDISALDPPAIKPRSKTDAAESYRKTYQELLQMVENPRPRQTGIARRGKDLAQDVTISFDEALHGGSKDIEVVGTQTCPACSSSGTAPGRTLSACPACQGTGSARETKETAKGPEYRFTTCTTCKGDGLVNTHPCQTCRGSGWIKIKRPFTLQIPAYIDSGAVICILHQGEPGRFGGLPGHLQITVNVASHAFLTRSGRDICVDLPVSADVARQGGRLRVPALETGRSFVMDLPAGTPSNALLPVSENEAYSLTARIEIYRPGLLFMRLDVNQRIKAIREWLGGADIEIPATGESDLGERISTSAVAATPGSTAAPGRSAQQAEFYCRRSAAFAEKGDREHSLADLNRAIELDPEYASAYDQRGAWYMSQKEPGKALADMNRACELAPNSAEYYYHRAMLYHVQQDVTKALADYTKALGLDSTNAAIYDWRGMAYTLQNDMEAALADFNQALQLDPTRADCYDRRAVVYQHKHDLAKSIADLTKALELDPDNGSVRSHRVQVFIQMKDLESALADANKLVEKHPGNAGVFHNRGYTYYLRSDFDKALADYNKALELDPSLVNAYNNRGRTYLKQSRYREAIGDFDKALKLQPGDSWSYLRLGQAYRGLGEKKKAIEYCQKALQTSQNPELCQEAQKLLSELA